MNNFSFFNVEIHDVRIIKPAIFGDERGYFTETYNEDEFIRAGITNHFVQDNQSKSRKCVLRGLHFQKHFPQAKLVRVINGAVFDVAVDLRENSATDGSTVITRGLGGL